LQKIRNTNLTIPVEGKGQASAILSLPEGACKKTAVIVAHGAGNDMHNPLLASFAEGLAVAGYPAMRFNFLYKERGAKAPDPEGTLIKTWQSAYRVLHEVRDLDIDTWVAAGKSMGGRIASQMVARGILPVDRIIFLGYPLHSASNKEKVRDAHLYQIKIPMLFFEGTRDPLCDLGRLQMVLKKLRTAWELYTIEGGDHSFHVPKSTGVNDEETHRRITHKAVEWLDSANVES